MILRVADTAAACTRWRCVGTGIRECRERAMMIAPTCRLHTAPRTEIGCAYPRRAMTVPLRPRPLATAPDVGAAWCGIDSSRIGSSRAHDGPRPSTAVMYEATICDPRCIDARMTACRRRGDPIARQKYASDSTCNPKGSNWRSAGDGGRATCSRPPAPDLSSVSRRDARRTVSYPAPFAT